MRTGFKIPFSAGGLLPQRLKPAVMAGLNGTAKAVPLQRPIFETSSRAERALAIYKRWISPLFPAACRYVPTCSEYAAEAVARYGVLRGGAMALGRVLRCHPLGGAGHDPVADIAEFRNFETTVRQTHHHETTKRIVIPSEARLSYAKESEPRDLGLESLSGELRRAKCTIPTQTGTKIQARAPSTRFARSGFRLAARTPPKRLKLGMTSF